MITPRSYLYVPGDREDRLTKSLKRGADAVIADLEDAVAPDAKDLARDQIVNWLDRLQPGNTQIWVRVNRGDRCEGDLRAVATHPKVSGVFLPKVDHPDELRDAQRIVAAVRTAGAASAGAAEQLRWAPMIESALGLVQIHHIAAAERVHQLHLGEMDLSADLGISPALDETELLYARSLLVIASRAAGLMPPAAPVSAEINDHAAYRQTSLRLRTMGFVGRDCIHPVQVEMANELFAPSPQEIAWASGVLEQAKTHPGAFRDADGLMVDEAVLRRARNTVHLAGSTLTG